MNVLLRNISVLYCREEGDKICEWAHTSEGVFELYEEYNEYQTFILVMKKIK